MADTNTPNILLLVADPTDVVDYTAHIGNNLTTIDSLMGAVDCLSTARPSNTYKGQIIYEHDSGRYVQNTGTKSSAAWTYMSHSALTCTSSARPSSGLTTSLLAYETDGTSLILWNGSSWTHLAYKALSCTSSTRPSGTQVFTGMIIWETDTTRFLVYNGSTWEQLSFSNFVCTSSSHPASPFTGLEIFETDTGLSAVYTGSAYNYTVGQVTQTQTLTGTTASVTFTVPSNIKHLNVKWRARTSSAVAADTINIQLNGVTTSAYVMQSSYGSNALSGAAQLTSTSLPVGALTGANATANYFGQGDIQINGWDDTTNFPSAVGTAQAVSTATAGLIGDYGGTMVVAGTNSTIKIFPNSGSFVAGSRFSVYGWM